MILATCAACSVSNVTTTLDDTSSIPPLAYVTPEAQPTVEPTPDTEQGELPAQRPADFAASFSETGGSAPWSQRIDIMSGTAQYEVWMADVTYVFDFVPTQHQLDFVYDEIRLGRFSEYQVIPFEDGEMIYDGGSSSYSASAGDYSHRLFSTEERIDAPITGHSPLRALAAFVDIDSVEEPLDRLTVVLEEGVVDAAQGALEIRFSLDDATFAMGEERWADTFEIAWSGGARQVPVTIAVTPWGQQQDSQVVSEQAVQFEPDGTVRIFVADDGSIAVTSG